jgi:hypothetical protein|tara:strand:+ start:191 stop:379 length:189 start_codon:yes stop_codon:yes gene_type:complete
MWQELLTALSLFLILEGIIPFISPSKYRNFVERMSQLEDSNLRFIGLVSMLIGLLLLFLIRI